MRPPDPGAPFYWGSGGEVLRWRPEPGAARLAPDAAERLERFHRAEAAVTTGSAGAFHRLRLRELTDALAAVRDWRRAAVA